MSTFAQSSVIGDVSKIEETWFSGISLDLHFDGPTPAKVRYLERPFRVIFEFNDADIDALPREFGAGISHLTNIAFGKIKNGSRMVMTFDEPYFVEEFHISAGSEVDESDARVEAEISRITPDEFATKTVGLIYEEQDLGFELPQVSEGMQELPLLVIDAGHGGIDPGAQSGGLVEKDITLYASLIIANAFLSTDRYRIALTRDDDKFVSLLNRRRTAEKLGADLFLSIHADALETGDARGTTIYTLSDEATTEAAAKFALFENRVDLFAGEFMESERTDLSAILTRMAQNFTLKEAEDLAGRLQNEWVAINSKARESRKESAAFAVLKAPEVPSLLLEIGYITNADDRKRMINKQWLELMAEKLVFTVDGRFYAE